MESPENVDEFTRQLAIAALHGKAKTAWPLVPSHLSTERSLPVLHLVLGTSTCSPACPAHSTQSSTPMPRDRQVSVHVIWRGFKANQDRTQSPHTRTPDRTRRKL